MTVLFFSPRGQVDDTPVTRCSICYIIRAGEGEGEGKGGNIRGDQKPIDFQPPPPPTPYPFHPPPFMASISGLQSQCRTGVKVLLRSPNLLG